jgi:PKD repeat protein
MNYFTKFFFLIFLFNVTNCFSQTGCTDYQASNYDPSAIINDGSCSYVFTSLPLINKCYIDSTQLFETSGILNNNNNFWTHVDDGDNSIYRIDTLSDSIFQRVTISNATNIDWEDITSDGNYIYIGDVGNNNGNRTDLRFYRVLKSNINSSTTAVNAGKIRYTYSDQVNFATLPHNNFYDCEAFIYLNDSIHLFTKGWVNKWTKHYVLSADTGAHVAQFVDSFYVDGLITSAAIQGDSLVILLGIEYWGANECFLWMLNDFSGSHFFSGNKRRFYLGNPYYIGQTEGICFTDTNKGYITNELVSSPPFHVPSQLREFDLNYFLAPIPQVPVITTSIDSIVMNLQACSDTGSATFIISNVSTFAGQDLYFSFDLLPHWITLSPLTDTLSPGDSVVVTVKFNSGQWPPGSYVRPLSILTNDPFHPRQDVITTLNINGNPCIAFTSIVHSCSGFTTFTSTAVNNPTTYLWDFGDGDTSHAVSPAHTYMASGNYTVTLIACNAVECDTAIHNVQIVISDSLTHACTPTTQSFCCGSGIINFYLNGPSGTVLSNSSSNAVRGYEDFSCFPSTNLSTNYSYAVGCRTGLTTSEYFKIWIDLNNDGLFDTLTEEVYSDFDTLTPWHLGFLAIPSRPDNVYGIPIRMRIASDQPQIPSPCLDALHGQHEDYSIILNFSVDVEDVMNENYLRIYPNPFSNFTNIDYTLMQSSDVSIEVFNLLGERANVIIDSEKQFAGKYNFQISEQSPGIYFVKFTFGERSFVRRLMRIN